MVRRGVIGDEVEYQSDVAGAQFFAGTIEIIPGTDARIRLVLAHRIRRAGDLAELPSGKSMVVCGETPGIGLKKSAAYGAALPDAHEPDKIESQSGDFVPFRCGDIGERNLAAAFAGKFFEPRPSVDFVKVRMGAVLERG